MSVVQASVFPAAHRVHLYLVAILFLIASVTAATSATVLDAFGGPGGNSKRFDCEAESYVIGFSGRAGAWLDQISAICAHWNPNTASLQPPALAKTTSAMGDSPGGDAIAETCPEGQAVAAIAVRTTLLEANSSVNVTNYTQQFVHVIRFTCQPLFGGSGQSVSKTFGSWSTGQVSRLWGPWTCPPRELAVGIHGRAGDFVDAIGLVCDLRPEPATVIVETDRRGGPVVAPGPVAGDKLSTGPIVAAEAGSSPAESEIPTGSPLHCRGGGNMDLDPTAPVGSFRIVFGRASAGAATQPPGEGECAWADRAVNLYEPQTLRFFYVAGNVEMGEKLKAATRKGGAFEVSAYNDLDSGLLQIASVTSVQPPADNTPPIPAPPPTPGPVADVCGPPGGTGVVRIADPKLNKLNVRSGPGGTVLGTIANGTQVSIIGPCGPPGSAGLTAPGTTTGSGWCQIDKPMAGCVAAQFLTLGDSGAAGLAKPGPQPPLPEPASLPAPSEGGEQGTTAVVVKAANVRSSPRTANNIIGRLPAGAQVVVTGCQSTWCRIAVAGDAEAWVHQSLLAFAGPAGGGVEPQVPPTPPPQGPIVAAGCARPAGPATIVIPEANLDKLNVRESPGGRVIETIPEGSEVSIIGECGSENAAGIAAPSGQGGTPGWCQIGSPVTGCVSAKYLVPGSGGAAGVAAIPPSPPTAPSFAGAWDTVAGGVAHSITFNQNGASVSGVYSATDGSSGTISGTVTGKVLRFAWVQADGVSGTGKFTLNADGRSFSGSYTFGQNPDVAEGSWSGSRQ